MADVNVTPLTQTAPPRLRILVVDDNHDSALSLAMMLSIMGHETRTAHDGESAVSTAESFLQTYSDRTRAALACSGPHERRDRRTAMARVGMLRAARGVLAPCIERVAADAHDTRQSLQRRTGSPRPQRRAG